MNHTGLHAPDSKMQGQRAATTAVDDSSFKPQDACYVIVNDLRVRTVRL